MIVVLIIKLTKHKGQKPQKIYSSQIAISDFIFLTKVFTNVFLRNYSLPLSMRK